MSTLNTNVDVLTPDWKSQAGRRLLTGVIPTEILGYRTPIDSASLQDLTELGVDIVPVPAMAEAMEILSSHASDTVAGAGVRQVRVLALRADFTIFDAIYNTNGVTPVPVLDSDGNAVPLLRINNMHSVAVGTFGAVAVGNVDIRTVGGGGSTYCRIVAGGNRALQAHFTIPSGMRGVLYGWAPTAITDNAPATRMRMFLRATALDGVRRDGAFLFQDIMVMTTGAPPPRVFAVPKVYPEMTDIKVSAARFIGAGVVEAAASVDLVLETV